jgi:SAM-dependent methyltransferase
MYGQDTSWLYEVQHSARGKDYAAEADVVVDAIADLGVAGGKLLDVACGTGGHFSYFRSRFEHVEGIDLSEPMLSVARDRFPDLRLHQGDMRTFELDTRFDAITCLFASIAYVDSEPSLVTTLENFARHLRPGGVVAVEPWWTPDRFLDRHVSCDLIESEGFTVARASHTVRDDDASAMTVHYLISSAAEGVRHVEEVHRAMLFSHEQYAAAFDRAGLSSSYVPDVLSGRGLYLGVRA